MVTVKQIVLDVLKPHHPNSLDFAAAISESVPGGRVELTVVAVDEHTETVVLVIEGSDLDFKAITLTITGMGGSVHSIDKVEVINQISTDG